MATVQASRDAFQRANDVTFGKSRMKSSNAQRNKRAVKKMTTAQKISGLTAEELSDVQSDLRQSFYTRLSA